MSSSVWTARPLKALLCLLTVSIMHGSGERAKIEVLRGSQRLQLGVPLVERPHKTDSLASSHRWRYRQQVRIRPDARRPHEYLSRALAGHRRTRTASPSIIQTSDGSSRSATSPECSLHSEPLHEYTQFSVQ